MPLYEFKTDDDRIIAGYFPVSQCPEPGDRVVVVDPDTGQEIEATRIISLAHTDMRAYQKPIEMYSIAVNGADEVRQFKQRNPDIKCSDNPSDPLYGVPVVKSRKQKKSVLKNEGFVEKN